MEDVWPELLGTLIAVRTDAGGQWMAMVSDKTLVAIVDRGGVFTIKLEERRALSSACIQFVGGLLTPFEERSVAGFDASGKDIDDGSICEPTGRGDVNALHRVSSLKTTCGQIL